MKPSVIKYYNGALFFYSDISLSKLHNAYGPAVVHEDGTEVYFFDGIKYTKSEWAEKVEQAANTPTIKIRDDVLKLWQKTKDELEKIENYISGEDSINLFIKMYEIRSELNAYSKVLHLLEKE